MRQGDVSKNVTRVTCELLKSHGLKPVLEYQLPNGMRLDIGCYHPFGHLCGVEVKSVLGDFNRDLKWPMYMKFCTIFFIAVPEGFPLGAIPLGPGIIVATGERAFFHRRNRWSGRDDGSGLYYPSRY